MLTTDCEFNVLTALSGYISCKSWESPEELVYRHHANLHNRSLKVIQNAGLKSHGIHKFPAYGVTRIASNQVVESLLQHGFCNDELSDQIEDAIDAIRINAQNILHVRAS